VSVVDAIPLLLGDEGYQISRSVRLRQSASGNFSKTYGATGNQQLWTWSCWVKRGRLSDSTGGATLFSGLNGLSAGNSRCRLTFETDDTLNLALTNMNTAEVASYRTTALFRDPSAWYHVVVAIETGNATAGDRVKLYVNGTRYTTSGTTASLNANMPFGVNGVPTYIGSYYNPSAGTAYFDGYLTEINFIDGQALTPSSFGETNPITGVWQPKKYTGTYGTNGFFLNFSDNSSNTATTIGKDYSGNGNNWTPNNISVTSGATYDSMLDVPTNWADGGNGRGNYCTLNPLNRQTGSSAAVVTNGNLTITVPSGVNATPGAYAVATGTFLLAGGKWYFEAVGQQVSGSGGGHALGVTNALTFNFNGTNYYTSSFSNVSKSASAAADVLMIAYDADNNLAWVGKNGTWDAGNPSAGTGGTSYTGPVIPFAQGYNDTTNRVDVNCNFGQRPFTYTPPTGFRALNTLNLPEPTIRRGNQYFNAVTYTGTGAARSVTGAGFQPDLVWIKNRSAAISHGLNDSVRGAGKFLYSNLTDAEGNFPTDFASFDADGFSLGSATGAVTNTNGSSYVAWQWKEGATQGFDIVTYTGTGSNTTVAHNLGVAPRMIIFKRRSAIANWAVYHASIGNTGALALDLTIATDTNVAYFNNTSPTSSVFTVGTGNSVNASTSTYVAYLFAEVAGFSRFGSYTGNGSSDGPFVFTGFRPRWVMVKYYSGSGANHWWIWDTARNTYNAMNDTLVANLSVSEQSPLPIDVTANGFKFRTSNGEMNGSGTSYIYAAFAEFPFKTALAR